MLSRLPTTIQLTKDDIDAYEARQAARHAQQLSVNSHHQQQGHYQSSPQAAQHNSWSSSQDTSGSTVEDPTEVDMTEAQDDVATDVTPAQQTRAAARAQAAAQRARREREGRILGANGSG
ncbi:hypothetical protein EJ03DRAFT_349158 [Teratosphaeria nubilosa]|uniref:Anaphase-promoting complex, subunit CDC26 n=1 Tax=Teratosphaeria nubilosa TaxID=161662 RepID=A0A6G1LIF5_9PEZI|nr:hypothetical protein EJ03DRAFT_349158 [Teratosphaeria nubilosa]